MAGLLIFVFIGLTLGRPDPRINLDEDRLDNPDERGELFQGDMIIDFDPNKRNAIRSRLWPSGRIPYQFDSQDVSQFTSTDKSRIQQAIDNYSKYTCVRWVPKTSSDTAYVNIIRGQGCYSSVGRTGRKQTLSLGRGCTGKGTVIHEMMHAIGFHHEQCRTDRDSYVTIKHENIKDGKENNFQKYSVQKIQDLGAKYDYGSVMHYGPYAFSKNDQATIVPKQQGATIGNRAGFSNTDIFKINKLYQCSPVGTGAPVTRAPVTTQTVTTGGNANGASCVFPFIYRGISYSKCTTVDNNGFLWCATTGNYKNDKLYGNCVILTTGGNANGAACVFPFIYKGNSYRKCTTVNNKGVLWCATTNNYANDKQYGSCKL